MLDDVSTRYLPAQNVDELLSQLCLQSPEFGFKISTETQTLKLKTPGGEAARSGRDYELFDLGAEVLARLSSPGGTAFIEEVLHRRSVITDAMPPLRPSQVLGRQNLTTIAAGIREQPSKSPVYCGIDALAGVCVGDIGDILQVYALILHRNGGGPVPVPRDLQHKAMTDFAESKLFALAGRDQWLYSHASAFAEAAHRELKESTPKRVRQYNEVFVKIDPTEAQSLFPRIIRLIDAGVFVFTGGTPRTKTRHAAPFLQFKLAYRKVLGLTHRIPISMRDRFELSGGRLAEWLEAPSSAKLQPDRKRVRNKRASVVLSGTEPPIQTSRRTAAEQTALFDVVPSPVATPPADDRRLPAPHVLYRVETVAADLVGRVPVSWESKHVIAAFGFETRSAGAWENLLTAGGRPAGATMLQYPNIGLASQIIERLRSAGIPFNVVETGATMTFEGARRLLGECGSRDIVLDTTSLSKALIYALVSQALLARSEVWVLHTTAAEYYPSDAELSEVVSLFDQRRFPESFGRLDELVAGETGPYRLVPVGPQHRDPSQPSLMAAFVSLKHDRIVRLLEEAPVEAIAAIAPVDSSGSSSSRSRAAEYLAQYLVQRYGGLVERLPALDHDAAYRALMELHRRYALDGGYNFELGLTGTKMHAVGAGMFAATAAPASAYYSAPERFNPERFTTGTGATRIVHLRRVQA